MIGNPNGPRDTFEFGLGVLLGVLLGSVATFLLVVILNDHFVRIEWETLIAGVLAASGAGLTVVVINRQIRASEAARQKLQLQSDKVARAEANTVLAHISTDAGLAARALMEKKQNGLIHTGSLEPFNKLAGSENEAVAKWSLYLIRSVQVFNSRTKSKLDPNDPNLTTYIVDAFEIIAIANYFWGYIRGDTEYISTGNTNYPLYHGEYDRYQSEWLEDEKTSLDTELQNRNHYFLSQVQRLL